MSWRNACSQGRPVAEAFDRARADWVCAAPTPGENSVGAAGGFREPDAPPGAPERHLAGAIGFNGRAPEFVRDGDRPARLANCRPGPAGLTTAAAEPPPFGSNADDTRARHRGSRALSGGLIALFADLRPALARYLASRGAAADEGEDILQDVYLKLLGEEVGPVAQPRAYLYKMANNQFLAHRRGATRRTRREEDWVSAHSGGLGEADERPSAESEIIARQQLAILQRVLDDLPERTRAIFRRFRIEGEPQRAIAEQFGISVSAVEKHLARAYEAISDARLRLEADRAGARRLAGGMGRHVR